MFAVLGHKADLGVMALGPDLARLQAFQQELADHAARRSSTRTSRSPSSRSTRRPRTTSGPGSRAEEGLAGPASSKRSLAAWRERMAHYQEQRIHPQLPLQAARSASTRCRSAATADANWYALAVRRSASGSWPVTRASGARYAGRVLQLITGSTGLDDWEWGVTLLADDPVALKEIVYEMRFDPVSADYAEFGPFVTGLVLEPAEALRRVGLDAESEDRPCRSTSACSCRSPRSSSTGR